MRSPSGATGDVGVLLDFVRALTDVEGVWLP